MRDICNRLFSVFRVIIIKLHARGDVQFMSYRQSINAGTEIRTLMNGKIYIKKVSTQSNVHLVSVGGELKIGERVYFNRNSMAICRKSIIIGNNVSIGPNVCIYDHDHKFGFSGIIKDEYNTGDIVIENNCWIGAGAIILRNTCIGMGSVIGAGTVVSGKIPSNSLVTSGRQLTIDPIVDKSDRSRK